MNRNHYSF